MKTTPIFVLYHANCPDGFAAAWAAWMTIGNAATYMPVNYGEPLPDLPDGAMVIMVDFSYPRPILEALAERCQVTVLDHHPTAQEALRGLDFATFDLQKSGAVLAWEHFHGTDVPEMLLYIQDRDLWQWKLPASREINAGLWKGTPREFGAWKTIHALWHSGVTTAKERLIQAGEILATYDALTVDQLCKHPHWMRVLNWTVPAVASPVLQSEIGHRLLELHPTAPFAAIYMTLDDGTFAYSLRARHDDFDVSVVAKEFKGGGHKAAAGFRAIDRFTVHAKKEGREDG
ncbi:MAG TPA: hypothetical protein DIT13_04955 [Verrucomicrobiales bacterium]|nr:hypothetical protein [Verrucomicrobiales bacterium]HRJ09302.1 DHHA1 domain-containing protein [Prosthecobacter sp.]HRK15589.1 DHHA1 domain-containing protein [Prosthecobacter sp.]